jgi:hypothetical protein
LKPFYPGQHLSAFCSAISLKFRIASQGDLFTIDWFRVWWGKNDCYKATDQTKRLYIKYALKLKIISMHALLHVLTLLQANWEVDAIPVHPIKVQPPNYSKSQSIPAYLPSL